MALRKTDSVSDREALVVPSFCRGSRQTVRCGKQFEQVAAWWLRNDPIWTRQIKNVWLWADWPNRHASPDTGVDLVAEQYDGSLVAVQCKAYSESTPITKSSIDSFISASPRHNSHIVCCLQPQTESAGARETAG